jgi:hypothetical protein
MNDKFLTQPINAAFPVDYFTSQVEQLTELYGEDAPDAGRLIKTLYARKDREGEPLVLRAAGTDNESPQILTNGKMLVVGVYPTLKVYNAVLDGDLPNVDIISNEDLAEYIETWKIPTEENEN